jgi:co-chaperonin GroES (HSP10)
MFTPTNRNLLLELKASEQEEQTGVLLPEGFQPKAEFEVAKVVAVASDCNATWRQGSYIVFPSNMLQQVDINGRKVSLVSENYVLGYVEG